MVKSRMNIFSFIVMLLGVSFCTSLLITIGKSIYLGQTKTDPASVTGVLFFVAIAIITANAFFSILNIVTIDYSSKKITVKNFLIRRTKVYNLSDIDGYIDCVQRSRNASYKTIYLVKDGYYIRPISAFAYSNYSELKEALADLKYLGFKKFDVFTSIQVLFGMRILNENNEPL